MKPMVATGLVFLALAVALPALAVAEPAIPAPAPVAAAAPAAAPAAGPPAVTAPPAAAPIATPSLVGAGNRLLIGSLVLAALLLIASRLIRRMPLGRLLPRGDGPIKMLSRTHLGPKASLCLVEVESTTILLAITGEQISALHSWPKGAAAAVSGPAAPGPRPSGERDVPGQLRALSARLGSPR
jgi:flagellar biogenesis protein FliO